jgi:hypothetical protein
MSDFLTDSKVRPIQAQPGGPTRFGTLAEHPSGHVRTIADDARRYVFSNIFKTAAAAEPGRRTVVAVNQEYVLEVMRLDGEGAWWAAGHDEFALVMDGEVEVSLLRPATLQVEADADGAHLLAARPDGEPMGTIGARRGHLALLPANSAYRFTSDGPAVLLLQTVAGPHSEERWSEICQTS